MTSTGGAESASERDHVAEAAREVARAWHHAVSRAAEAADGTYSRTDAAADLDWWAATTARWTADLVACWAALVHQFAPSPAFAKQPSSRVTARVPQSISGRPLTLETTGFRAIGYGAQYFLPAAVVTFDLQKDVLPPGVDEFTVTIDCKGLPPSAHEITLIYEGEITSTETGALVTDPIRFVKPASS